MSDLTKSADQLIAEVTEMVKKGLNEKLAPILKRMADAARDLEAAVGGSAAAPARGPRPGRRPGRPPKAKSAAAPAAPGKKRGPKPRGSGARNPRGALQGIVRTTLTAAGGGMSLTEIRDSLMKNSMFAGRNEKTLYTQIVQSIKKMPDVRKTAGGKYGLKSAASGAKATRRGK